MQGDREEREKRKSGEREKREAERGKEICKSGRLRGRKERGEVK